MMTKTRICRGVAKLSGKNTVSVSFGKFTGTPTVTATIMSGKNGATVCLRSVSASGATFAAFCNGGLMLNEGSIHWIAIGPCTVNERCYCIPGGHDCSLARVIT